MMPGSTDPSFCPPLAPGEDETCTHTPPCPTGSRERGHDMSREAAETIIRAAFPHEPHPEDMVSEVLGNIDTVDAEPEGIAHDLWMLGAGVEHDGCPYGGPEPEDGHYENACGVCQAHLLAIAERIAAEVTGSSDPSPHEFENEHGVRESCSCAVGRWHDVEGNVLPTGSSDREP